MVITHITKNIFIMLVCLTCILLMTNKYVSFGQEENEVVHILENYNFERESPDDTTFLLKCDYEPNEQRLMDSFDIREDGVLAVLFDNQTLVFFDDKMGLIQAYRLTDAISGNIVVWLNENLFIYDVKSNIAIEVNLNGETVSFFPDCDRDVTLLCEELTSIDHSFDGKMYFLSVSKNKIKSSVFELESYPYLICVDRNGKKIILYDASRKYIVANCFFWVGLCFVFLLLIILGLKTYYSRHK